MKKKGRRCGRGWRDEEGEREDVEDGRRNIEAVEGR
jgi:hypothetical protein